MKIDVMYLFVGDETIVLGQRHNQWAECVFPSVVKFRGREGWVAPDEDQNLDWVLEDGGEQHFSEMVAWTKFEVVFEGEDFRMEM